MVTLTSVVLGIAAVSFCLILILKAYPSVHSVPTSHNLDSFELLGELYYANQKKERNCERGKELIELVPQFPCVRGITPIGTDAKDSIIDGHKFACGIHAISSAPIIYSFGSAKHQQFELSLIQLRPDAQIYTFEIDAAQLPPMESRHPSIHYYNIGLGYAASTAGKTIKSLQTIMKELGHNYVDVLKMDIEGFEWEWLDHEVAILPRIGQFLVELHLNINHIHFENRASYFGKALYFLEKLEGQDMRLFFKETNTNNPDPCEHPKYYTELSFIQKRWGLWDATKKNQPII